MVEEGDVEQFTRMLSDFKVSSQFLFVRFAGSSLERVLIL